MNTKFLQWAEPYEHALQIRVYIGRIKPRFALEFCRGTATLNMATFIHLKQPRAPQKPNDKYTPPCTTVALKNVCSSQPPSGDQFCVVKRAKEQLKNMKAKNRATYYLVACLLHHFAY